MKKLLLFSLLMSAFLLANGCVNSSYHDNYDSRHRPPPPGHRPPPDSKPAFRPDHNPGQPPAIRPDSRPGRPTHRP